MFSRESKLFSVDPLQVERWCLMEVTETKQRPNKKDKVENKKGEMEKEKKVRFYPLNNVISSAPH